MKLTKLADIATLTSGGTPPRAVASYFGEGTRWAAIGDLNDGIVEATKESLTSAGLTNSAAKVVPAGTILVAMYGASIGKLGIAGRSLCTNQAIAAIRPDSRALNERYLFQFLLAQRKQLRARGRGGAQPNIGLGDLQGWPIPLPPLAEQRRIAAILDRADELRTLARSRVARIKGLPSAMFTAMFLGSKFETRELAEVVQPGTIVTYGIVQAGPDYDGGVPYIRTGDIEDGEIGVQNLRRTNPAIARKFERSAVGTGDIVMSIRATVGTTAVVPPELNGANLTQGTARISPSELATGPYLLAYLRSEEAQRWIQAQVKGATFREITLGRLRQLPVPIAATEAQAIFASRAGSNDQCLRRAITAVGSFDKLFYSIQSRAFAGQL